MEKPRQLPANLDISVTNENGLVLTRLFLYLNLTHFWWSLHS